MFGMPANKPTKIQILQQMYYSSMGIMIPMAFQIQIERGIKIYKILEVEIQRHGIENTFLQNR